MPSNKKPANQSKPLLGKSHQLDECLGISDVCSLAGVGFYFSGNSLQSAGLELLRNLGICVGDLRENLSFRLQRGGPRRLGGPSLGTSLAWRGCEGCSTLSNQPALILDRIPEAGLTGHALLTLRVPPATPPAEFREALLDFAG